MRPGRITLAVRRKRNPVFKARCGICGNHELTSTHWHNRGAAYDNFTRAGWRNLGRFGWTCPGCSVFLLSAQGATA